MIKKKHVLPLLLLLQIIIVNILAAFPEFVEKYYSNGLYPFIAAGSRSIFGLVPFSVGDIIYGIVLVFAFRWLWLKRKTWGRALWGNVLGLLSFMSVFYFLFHLLWAMNYHRVPLHEKMGMEKKYELAELIPFTKKLIAKTNAMQVQITGNDSTKVVNPYTIAQIYDMSLNGYNRVSAKYLYFKYERESIKSSLISTPLSYMGFGGYLNPFTNEAQVNANLPLYNLPTTTCHEMAHQIGYASESEANFIGYLASVDNEDVYFQYSGYSFALKYCMRSIEKLDEKTAESLVPLINKGVRKNFKESKDFNEKYSSFIETGFEFFYDNFLKLNKQKDGLEGYSKFVGLLVNYHKQKEL
ncbi:DUF3810 domain-containing protein [Flavobacterium sp. J372]|uniref:DUF3810 domain-containing protein n=1 Tax=Flavobacterium sp. J372 TaxID=2898436 RepID=UPI0027E228CB|nr:DUF3810 domain-containing protein [Flavobacterium sp. J372]